MFSKPRSVFLSCLLFLTGIVFFPNAFAQTPYVQELNRLEAQSNHKELFAKLLAFEPFSRLPAYIAQAEIKETLDWLAKRGMRGPGSVRYTYNYAMWLWKVGILDTATAVYLFGTIKARSDGVRCEDQTSAPSRIRDYEISLGSAVRANLGNLSQQARLEIFQLAITELESRLPMQPKDEWLCGGGMSFFTKYAAKHGSLNGRTVETPPGMIGQTVVVTDPDIKPDFIADQEWLAKRREPTIAQVEVVRKFLFDTVNAK